MLRISEIEKIIKSVFPEKFSFTFIAAFIISPIMLNDIMLQKLSSKVFDVSSVIVEFKTKSYNNRELKIAIA